MFRAHVTVSRGFFPQRPAAESSGIGRWSLTRVGAVPTRLSPAREAPRSRLITTHSRSQEHALTVLERVAGAPAPRSLLQNRLS